MKRYVPDAEWPYGLPMIVCPRCSGTGADSTKLTHEVVHSRELKIDPDRYRCDACEGRGKILVKDAGAVAARVR